MKRVWTLLLLASGVRGVTTIALIFCTCAWAQVPVAYRIRTFAGANPTNDPSTVRDEYISYPNSIAVDAEGNVYYNDLSRCLIRKISPDGKITTAAGSGVSGFTGDGGPATAARINGDANIALDADGNLYISDTYNLRIRKVTKDGIIRTIAGNGLSGTSGDGGSALAARFSLLGGIGVDGAGNIYAATIDGRIRRITPAGVIDTVAGTGQAGYSGDGGPAVEARIYSSSVAADLDGTLYLADAFNFRIRKVTPDGIITTIAGNGQPGFAGDGDGGQATSAKIGYVSQLKTDGNGSVYFAEAVGNRIRKIGTDGIIQTIAGTGQTGYTGDGGPAVKATMSTPADLALGPDGTVYFSDVFNQVIRAISPDGTINTFAGRGRYAGDGGLAVDAILNDPWGVARDTAGNIYISENAEPRIRKVSSDGIITNFAGTGKIGMPKEGPANSVDLAAPTAMAADGMGNVNFIDANVVWRITPDGNMTRFAGTGAAGFTGDGGPATSARLGSPQGLAVDSAGNLLISDTNNHAIRQVSADGSIQTLAGTGRAGLAGDGGQARQAQFASPRGIAVDDAGNVYVADFGNRRIRKIGRDGVITTVAGTGRLNYLDNGWPDPQGDGGPAVDAELIGPVSVAVDPEGSIFIGEHADPGGFYWGNRIRRVTPDGIIDTIAGTGQYGFAGDGALARDAQLHYISQIATDQAGRAYVVDRLNFRIRMLTPLYGSSRRRR